jgi:hypothetical protein
LLFAKPSSKALQTLQNQWVKSYNKKGEALQTICTASLIHIAMLAFLDSSDRK